MYGVPETGYSVDMQYGVGIDEVGRGPLAGPVTVCAVQWLSAADPATVLAGIRDSKKLSAAQREMWAEHARRMTDMLRFRVSSVSPHDIDADGIMPSLATAARRSVAYLNRRDPVSHIHSDYGLPLPGGYTSTHIVKGDEKHPLIALASVIAKTERDAVMCRIAAHFDGYGFERNKGYGTREHRDAIRRHGVCPAHRMTFVRNIPLPSRATDDAGY